MEMSERKIHQPKYITSQQGMGLPNTTKSAELIDANTLVTTEIWNEMDKPWTQSGITTANKGYKWITKWEVGKNYVITGNIDDKGNLLSYYCDICSSVERNGDNFSFTDWYLDVFLPVGGVPEILDEEELEEALVAGYLTNEQANTAKVTADKVVSLLKSGELLIGFPPTRE